LLKVSTGLEASVTPRSRWGASPLAEDLVVAASRASGFPIRMPAPSACSSRCSSRRRPVGAKETSTSSAELAAHSERRQHARARPLARQGRALEETTGTGKFQAAVELFSGLGLSRTRSANRARPGARSRAPQRQSSRHGTRSRHRASRPARRRRPGRTPKARDPGRPSRSIRTLTSARPRFLSLLAEGCSNTEMGAASTSAGAPEHHVARILSKLGLGTEPRQPLRLREQTRRPVADRYSPMLRACGSDPRCAYVAQPTEDRPATAKEDSVGNRLAKAQRRCSPVRPDTPFAESLVQGRHSS